jgi:hypothetical protein
MPSAAPAYAEWAGEVLDLVLKGVPVSSEGRKGFAVDGRWRMPDTSAFELSLGYIETSGSQH